MTVASALLFGVAGVLILFLVKPIGKELHAALRCGILLCLFGAAAAGASLLLSSLSDLLSPLGLPASFSILRRAAGIAFGTALASGVCRELGEGGIADGLELFGKIQLLLAAVPLLSDLFSLVGSLLDAGGIA